MAERKVVPGYQIGERLCALLGIDPNTCFRIAIDCHVAEVATVTVWSRGTIDPTENVVQEYSVMALPPADDQPEVED